MNFLLKLTIFLSIVTIVYSDDDNDSVKLDDMVDAIMGFADGCEEPKPEREHAKEMILFKEDAQTATKCLRYCLMNQFNMIPEGETKVDKAETVKIMSMLFSDAEEVLGEIVDGCNAQNENILDKCENAHSQGICIYKGLQERDFQMPTIEE